MTSQPMLWRVPAYCEPGFPRPTTTFNDHSVDSTMWPKSRPRATRDVACAWTGGPSGDGTRVGGRAPCCATPHPRLSVDARTPGPPSSSEQEGTRAMSLTRVQFFSVSLDGFGTGEGQSLETPFGHAGERLHEWMFRTRWWRQMVGEPGGSAGLDDAFLRLHDPGVGAEIMG